MTRTRLAAIVVSGLLTLAGTGIAHADWSGDAADGSGGQVYVGGTGQADVDGPDEIPWGPGEGGEDDGPFNHEAHKQQYPECLPYGIDDPCYPTRPAD
jgi:hypothetical protein